MSRRVRKIRSKQIGILWQPSQDLWNAAVNALERDPVNGGVAQTQSTLLLQALLEAAKTYMRAADEVMELQRIVRSIKENA